MARLTLCTLICLFVTYTRGQEIVYSDSERCRYETSSGVIDLNPLASDSGTPRFKDVGEQSGMYAYSWNPCTIFNENSCDGVEVCQVDMTNPDNDYVLGRPGESSFEEISGQLYLVFRSVSPIDGNMRTTNIELVCDASVDGKLESHGENPPLTYSLTLTSRHACPVSLTTPGHTVGPTGRPTAGPSPGPDIYSIKTITILLACILLSLLLLVFQVFMGLITRRK